MSLDIKVLTPADRENLQEVYTIVVQSEFPEYSQRIRDFFSSPEYAGRMVTSHFQIGAFDGKKLVGFLLGQKPFGGVIFIPWLAVLKEYQGKGMGRALLEKMDEIAKPLGVHSLQLTADARNIPFYEKMGYEQIGFDKKGYFGTDNYIMRKILQEPQESAFF